MQVTEVFLKKEKTKMKKVSIIYKELPDFQVGIFYAVSLVSGRTCSVNTHFLPICGFGRVKPIFGTQARLVLANFC